MNPEEPSSDSFDTSEERRQEEPEEEEENEYEMMRKAKMAHNMARMEDAVQAARAL